MGCLDPRVIGELERKEKKRRLGKYVLHNLTPQFFTQISHQFSHNFQCNILFKILLFNRRSEMSDILSY